jgi:hypothetical protein
MVIGNFFESLILAQDERWRCALSMQVERRDDESQDLLSISGGRVSISRERTQNYRIARRKTG